MSAPWTTETASGNFLIRLRVLQQKTARDACVVLVAKLLFLERLVNALGVFDLRQDVELFYALTFKKQ